MQMTMRQACNKIFQDNKSNEDSEWWILSKCLFVTNWFSDYSDKTRKEITILMEQWVKENGYPLFANLQRWIDNQDDKEVLNWQMVEDQI